MTKKLDSNEIINLPKSELETVNFLRENPV